jgi:hypothetical protein
VHDSSWKPIIKEVLEETFDELQRRGLPVHPEWLSPEQVSVYCGFAVITLEHMRRRGEGCKYHKVGHLIRYRRTDLDAWLASHAVQPKAVTP